MKSFFRIALLLAVVALGVYAPMAVRAQGACTLSADDCKLIDDVTANSDKHTKFTIDSWAFTASVTGLPQGDVNINVSGNGAVDVSKISSADASDALAAAKALTLALNIASASAKMGAAEQKGDLEIRIVDGVVYVKGSNPSSAGGTDGKWLKMSLDKLFDDPSFKSTFEQAFQAGSQAGMAGAGMGALGAMPNLVKTEAGDGEAVGGMPTRSITTSINFAEVAKMLSNPSTSSMFQNLPGGAGAQLQALLPLLQPILEKTSFSFVQYLGKEDKLFHGFDINLDIADISSLMMMMGGGAGGAAPSTTPMKVEVRFTVRLTGVGEDVTVEVPADAVEAPMN
jgi:hypothetical protein